MSINPSLDAELLARIDLAAAPLQAGDRPVFVQAVHERLLSSSSVLGPGLLHRVLAEAQAVFLRERPIIPDGPDPPSKYARVRRSPFVQAR